MDDVVTTFAGGMETRKLVGTAPQTHQLAAGAGPGGFLFAVPGAAHTLSGMAGANRFGGGFRASRSATLRLSFILAGGLTATGTLRTGPNLRGHGRSVPTQVVTNTGTFVVGPTVVPLRLKIWQMPFTTGRVVARNTEEGFATTRIETGFDARTPLGEHGTLQLVSHVEGLPNHYGWSGTSSLTFEFLPEPGATTALIAGFGVVLGHHLRARSRSQR